VENKFGLNILIDYAHSPESLKSVIKALKPSVKNGGRLITLFGCGGDRDNSKRPIMGKIAVENSDFAIITSDNPRTENPEEIIKQILAGIDENYKNKYIAITDRIEAIKYGIKIANENDILLLAGKGHETYQEINHVKNHFDEREIVNKLTKLLGQSHKNNKILPLLTFNKFL
jgi:UDP-N-acetylmuramoyl-L-alanyl-D-glutamate--2,6-diaminopimelate ligase